MEWEETVRGWVRDELARCEAARQAKCGHARSATLDDDCRLVCDDCGKELTTADR